MNKMTRVAAGLVRASVSIAIVGIILLPVLWTVTAPAIQVA